jgi:hypothetical protein
MESAALDLLEKYQTAIAAAVGFLGGTVTLLVHAAIARRQARNKREIER